MKTNTCIILLFSLLYSLKSFGQIPIANFTSDVQGGCAPFIVKFTNTSSNNPTSFIWDLGDGNISLQKNPIYVYETPGVYSIKLIVKNATGTDSIIKTNYITVEGFSNLNFSVSDSVVCFPGSTNFASVLTPSTPSLSYLWDFGDGVTSNASNPTHIYTFLDTFTVFLKITTPFGCERTATKPNFVRTKPKPISNFSVNALNNCTAPQLVSFVNNSALNGAGPLTFNWDFGNGNFSNLLAPTHNYLTNGTYNVTLNTTAANGCTSSKTLNSAVILSGSGTRINLSDTICQFTEPTATLSTAITSTYNAEWFLNGALLGYGNNFTNNYNLIGNFRLMLVIKYGFCSDTVVKNITVVPIPALPSFTANQTRFCSQPAMVNFTNTSTNLTTNTFIWDFGDGNTSSDVNPTHTYTQFGNFTVKLKSISVHGCKNEAILYSYIQIVAPTIITLPVIPTCINTPFLFSIGIYAISAVTSYTWNLGDGSPTFTTTTNTNIPAIYTAPGNYDIIVTVRFVDGCVLTAVARSVNVGIKPTANFTIDETSKCASAPFLFTNLSTNATNYEWSINKNSDLYNSATDPIVNFKDTGTATVMLIAINNGCPDTMIKTNLLFIKPPYANFDFSYDCPERLRRNFFALPKTKGATSYAWNLSDGTTSILPNFSALLNISGPQTYNLTAENSFYGCTYNVLKTENIRSNFNFTASQTQICRGEQVSFTTDFNTINFAISPYSVIKYFKVNYGDGIFREVIYPGAFNFTYTDTGTYTVQIVFFNPQLGCLDTVTKINYIQVYGTYPNTNIIPQNTTSCFNLGFTLNDFSTPYGGLTITNIKIDWGDGIVTNTTTPSSFHTYINVGSYLLTYEVTDSRGCKNAKTFYLHTRNSIVRSSFVVSDYKSCPNGFPVNFTNASVGSNLSFLWNFGDGNTSILRDPSHIYTQNGNYNVQLIVNDLLGCKDTFKMTNAAVITTPKATFNLSDSASFCNPSLINVLFTGANATSYNYTFGDGSQSVIPNPQKIFNSYGVFTTKLVVNSYGGCMDSSIKTIEINNPNIQVTLNNKFGCRPFKFNFNNTSNGGDAYVWQFGDGFTEYNTGGNASYTYNKPGNYIPKLFIIDNAGCFVNQSITDTIKVFGTLFDFNKSIPPACDTASLTFTPQITANNSAISNYNWLFSNLQTSSLASPSIPFNPGSYIARLIITTTEGCKDTITKNNFVTINYLPKVTIFGPDTICRNALNQYKPIVSNPYAGTAINYQWLSSNGSNSTNTLFNTTTNTLGNFSLSLKATDPISGCNSTTNYNVFSSGIDFDFTKTQNNICDTSTVQFSFNPVNVAPALKNLLWTFGNGLNNTISTPTTFYNNGNFNVGLKATTTSNCIEVITKNDFVKINKTPKINFTLKDSFCLGEKITLNPTISNGPFSSLKYYWFIDEVLQPNNSLNTIMQFNATGYKNITFKAEELLSNCTNIYSVKTYIKPCNVNIFVPNSFAPNGINRIVFPTPSIGVNLVSFEIFNRWGNLVYKQNDFGAGQGFNGIVNGIPQPTQTFAYKVTGKLYDGSIMTKNGTITLIR
jgi:PKD repeat protein